MKLKYTALGNKNQKLEGVLDADSLDAGREELHKMGLSVIAINEISEEEAARTQTTTIETKKQEGISTFYFSAKDPQGKEVNGTIDSKTGNSAFRRLIMEYGFEVVDLYPEGSPNPEAESLKAQFGPWKLEMEDEGIDLSKKATAQTKGELEEGEKMSEEVIGEIDRFIINTKELLKTHSTKYSDAFLREIQKTLDELEKIRASNNLKHITKVCNDLYELISNPDQVSETDEAEADAAYQEAISRLRGSGFVSNPFDFLESQGIQDKFKAFGKIKEVMGQIGTKLGVKKKKTEAIRQKKKNRFMARLSRALRGGGGAGRLKMTSVLGKFFDYITASSPILRKAKKQEMLKTFRAWKEQRKQAKMAKKTGKQPGEEGAATESSAEGVATQPEEKKDYSAFFMEIDSFVGWLLFFYIIYFFLVSFSIEKNVGLPQDLVIKTLSSPLIVNISIFLLIAHLALTLKINFFKSNFLGSLFLFFLSFGAYAILMVNF